jgi:hypothetical protein
MTLAPMCSNNHLSPLLQRVPTMIPGHAGCLVPMKSVRQTDMDGPIRCSSLILAHEEHLIKLKILPKTYQNFIPPPLNAILHGKNLNSNMDNVSKRVVCNRSFAALACQDQYCEKTGYGNHSVRLQMGTSLLYEHLT